MLARRKNQMLEVDVTEEAKLVAYIAMNSPASYTTTMRSSISSTTTSPSWSRSSATRSPSSARRDDQFHRVGRHVDRKYAAMSAEMWHWTIGSSDVRASASTKESCAAHAAPSHPVPSDGCETCSAAIEAATLSLTKSMEVPQRYQELQMYL